MTDPQNGPPDADSAMPPGQAVWNTEVMRALDCLDELDRAGVLLVYGQGLSQAQVAEQLAIEEPVVRACVARGMRKLADRLSHGWTG